MIPFNKIPRGLRVPLFFGELAIDGDVLGGSPQPPQPGISCVGATQNITLALFGLVGEVVISVNEIEREFISSGETIVFTDWFNNEFGHLVTCYWGDFAQFDIANSSLNAVRISIKSNSFIEDIPYQILNNPTFGVEGDTLYFCLDHNINACVALPPANFNLDKTLYKLDKNKNYFLYYRGIGNAVQEIEVYSSMNLDENVGVFSIQDFPRLNGFIVDCTSETELYPETCNTFVYEGIYYVKQRVQTWDDHHYIGSFYVDVNGVRTYLQNSSKNFPHHGASATLREVLEPYYKDVAAFLVSFGVDAVYVPDFWGSYNTGGVKVIRKSNQYETIKFGSEAGYDLMFDGLSDPNCISFKTFEELENGPSSLSIQPGLDGNPSKIEYTLLGTHIPAEENNVNILRVLEITRDINISSCYEDMPG